VFFEEGAMGPFNSEGEMPRIVGSDTLARIFVDAESCRYFGYAITVQRLDANTARLRLGPVPERAAAEAFATALPTTTPCRHPRPIAAAGFPEPLVVPLGRVVDLTVLQDGSGRRIGDRIRVFAKAAAPAGFTDLWLRVDSPSTLVVDGEPLRGGGCAAQVLIVETPAGDRFAISLAARQGLPFVRAGRVTGERIRFVWQDVRYEWISREPVLGDGVQAPVWVLKMPPRTSPGPLLIREGRFGCHAIDAEHFRAS
jgi:hypothetical protein